MRARERSDRRQLEAEAERDDAGQHKTVALVAGDRLHRERAEVRIHRRETACVEIGELPSQRVRRAQPQSALLIRERADDGARVRLAEVVPQRDVGDAVRDRALVRVQIQGIRVPSHVEVRHPLMDEVEVDA